MALSFLGMANIAVRLVHEQYPEAQLYEADGTPVGHLTTDALEIINWQFVFRTNKGIAFIHSRKWGEFTPVKVVDGIWLGDLVIRWPIQLELVDAVALAKAAGYAEPFSAVTLRWPLYPGNTEPFYIITRPNKGYVFVGVNTRTVSFHSG